MNPQSNPGRRIPWGIVLATAGVVLVTALVVASFDRSSLDKERARLVKRRAELKAAIDKDYQLLRDEVEPWAAAAAAAPWDGDRVDPDALRPSWLERPAVYLRLRLAEATSRDAVHVASRQTALDGLTSCLLHSKGIGPWPYGELVYRAEMLGADFLRDVRETANDLRIRNLAYALEHYEADDYQKAREGIRLAEYVVLALDEDPPAVPARSAAFGDDASVAQRIAGTRHPVRVHVKRLADRKELLRLRRTPDATLVSVSGDNTATAAAIELRQSQALGCAMASEVLEAIGAGGSPSMESAPAALHAAVAVPSASTSSSASPPPSGSARP